MTELQVQRQLTAAFIDAAPVSITLIPRVRQDKPAGGWVYVDQAPREPQTMKLVEPTITQGTRPTVAQDGIEREIIYVLLGAWDAQIGLYDRFVHEGLDFDVVDLLPDNGWERRALVARHGSV